MFTETELVILPYDSQDGKSLLEILVNEFLSQKWISFQAAVAFLRASGNFSQLLEAMQTFLRNSGTIEITAGADTFSHTARGSDYDAIALLLSKFVSEPNFKLYLYHEKIRTFHPKLYLFSNEKIEQALLIIGSSNWSYGGLVDNIEVNALIKLNLGDDEHRQNYQKIKYYFATYWAEAE